MQPSYEITQHPVDLKRHGLNVYGEPLYRVVWADTRKSKVICRGKAHILPRYHHGDEGATKGKWILEKWAAGETIVGMTREKYEEFLAATPNVAAEEFPERGDYELSYVFKGNVDEIFLHAQLDMHEFKLVSQTNADRAADRERAEEVKEQQNTERFETVYEEAREESFA